MIQPSEVSKVFRPLRGGAQAEASQVSTQEIKQVAEGGAGVAKQRHLQHVRRNIQRLISEKADKMVDQSAKKLTPIQVNDVVRVSTFSLRDTGKNESDTGAQTKMRMKQCFKKGQTQTWTGELFRVIHRKRNTQDTNWVYMIEPYHFSDAHHDQEGIKYEDKHAMWLFCPDQHAKFTKLLKNDSGTLEYANQLYFDPLKDPAEIKRVLGEGDYLVPGHKDQLDNILPMRIRSHYSKSDDIIHEDAESSQQSYKQCWCHFNFTQQHYQHPLALGNTTGRIWYGRTELKLVTTSRVPVGHVHNLSHLQGVGTAQGGALSGGGAQTVVGSKHKRPIQKRAKMPSSLKERYSLSSKPLRPGAAKPKVAQTQIQRKRRTSQTTKSVVL